jgi:acyl-CoA hydrolase
MDSDLLRDHLRPGDRLVIGQVAGEPVGLVDALFSIAPDVGLLDVFCGFSLNPAWGGTVPSHLRVTTYCGLGTVRAQVSEDRARVVPASLSQLSSLIASRAMPVDAVLLQVAPADADGYHSLGCTMDYVWEACRMARVVLVEVNPAMPKTRSAARLHRDQVVVVGRGEAELPETSPEPPNEVQREVAARAAALVPDGAAIQLGIGGLAAAVAEELRDRRGLRIRSGMVGDWYLDLLERGALDISGPDSCLASLAVGSRRLYEALSPDGPLGFAPPAELVRPIAGVPLMAINSAIDVDLKGQVNAEFLGQRYVGTVGGQTDYFRAARASDSGLAILALPSTSSRGASRIVPQCLHVSTAQSEVDLIVTEHGVADLRGTTLTERAGLIAGIAAPQHRDALMSGGDLD